MPPTTGSGTPSDIAQNEIGWLAWLSFEGELFDQFTTLEDAQAAVEQPLTAGSPSPATWLPQPRGDLVDVPGESAAVTGPAGRVP